mmetsp:Transcript_80598/g.250111  ORF Transcript_80598/g.250111 Transcript_80598/m.250111 type:complete len:251 (+) Transcript_80598:162-914(+)
MRKISRQAHVDTCAGRPLQNPRAGGGICAWLPCAGRLLKKSARGRARIGLPLPAARRRNPRAGKLAAACLCGSPAADAESARGQARSGRGSLGLLLLTRLGVGCQLFLRRLQGGCLQAWPHLVEDGVQRPADRWLQVAGMELAAGVVCAKIFSGGVRLVPAIVWLPGDHELPVQRQEDGIDPRERWAEGDVLGLTERLLDLLVDIWLHVSHEEVGLGLEALPLSPEPQRRRLGHLQIRRGQLALGHVLHS